MVYTLKASTPQLKNSLHKELQVYFLQKASKIKILKKLRRKNSQNPPPKWNTKTPTPDQSLKSLSNGPQNHKYHQPEFSLPDPLTPCPRHQKETFTTLKATLYIQWGVQMIKILYVSLFSFHPCNQFMDRKSGTAILRPQVCIHGQVFCFLNHNIQ